jgi:hypothetical protein
MSLPVFSGAFGIECKDMPEIIREQDGNARLYACS